MSRADIPPLSSRNHESRGRDGSRGNRSPSSNSRFSRAAASALLLLLVAPLAALYRLSFTIDYRLLAGYVVVISVGTYGLYVSDKRKAQRKEWRTPELNLHIGEFLGGWAAAFVAQRVIRHKISKAAYQWSYWTIVIVHQYVAFDYLLDWSLTRGISQLLQHISR